MINRLRQLADWCHTAPPTILERHEEFRLSLGNLPVGHLSHREGEWIFRYSEAFRQQDRIVPIMGFPDVDREYRCKDLWPFFILRVPSKSQIAVQEYMKEMAPQEVDEASLLRKFGRRSVANPFELVPTDSR